MGTIDTPYEACFLLGKTGLGQRTALTLTSDSKHTVNPEIGHKEKSLLDGITGAGIDYFFLSGAHSGTQKMNYQTYISVSKFASWRDCL